jgi:prevent-host-death family protein
MWLPSWPIHEAKARLSELVKCAQHRSQQLTSHGEPVAVVIPAEEWQRQQHQDESLVAFIRREPEPRVVKWLLQRPARVLYLSVLSLGEIRRGVKRLEEGRRARALRRWLEDELLAWCTTWC